MQIKEGLSFDDVLLKPRKSRVFSRQDVDLKTKLTKNIEISVPIVSANMDTVTGHKMARVMAELGGIGIIHRFLSIEEQAGAVRKVKRAESVVIDDPYTIREGAVLEEAQRLMKEHGVSGLLVVDNKNKLTGILTSRDLLFEDNPKKIVSKIMSKDVITAPPNVSTARAKKLLHQNRIEKLPLVDKQKRVQGLITLKDILKKTQNPNSSKDRRGRLLVGAAVGAKDGELERAKALLDAGCDVLVVDIAHGHNIRAIEMVRKLRKKFDGIEIVAGNVATAEGVQDLAAAGADAVKVGIGPGAACTTRMVTGVGVPQVTAILECSKQAKKLKVPVIADGGIKNSGDLSKALAAGAQTAMLGSLLAGCQEAPGEYIIEDGVAYKIYRGMASREAATDKARLDGALAIGETSSEGFGPTPEGKAGRVHYRGPTKDIVSQLLAGLRSSMSYLGAKDLRAFVRNAEFVKMSEAGLKESQARNT